MRVPTVAPLGISTFSRRFKISDFDFENENDEDAFCNCRSRNWSNALVMPHIRTPKPLVLEIVKTSALATADVLVTFNPSVLNLVFSN